MNVPNGVIAVPVPKAVLLVTEVEYVRGQKRGKWWRRRHAEAKRDADAVTPHTPRAPGRDRRSGRAYAAAQALSQAKRLRGAALSATEAHLGKQNGV